MKAQKLLKIGVIPGGSFGTALGSVAAKNGHKVTTYSKNPFVIEDVNKRHLNTTHFPKEITLPENLKASNNLREIFESDLIIHSIPVQKSLDFIKENIHLIPEGVPYIVSSKGMLLKEKKFFSEVWGELFKGKNVPHLILSGPSFAIEILREYPTLVTLACKDLAIADFAQKILSNSFFKVYTSSDVIGVEIGGALKNPLAIASGIVEGSGFGSNTTSALVTRGFRELGLIIELYGGKKETFYGLSGLGDIMLSCFGPLSRNKNVGIRLARGEKLEDIIKEVEVAEGIHTTFVLGELMKRHNLEKKMPIMSKLNQLLKGEIDLKDAKEILIGHSLERENQLF